jgi:hypothetical protein
MTKTNMPLRSNAYCPSFPEPLLDLITNFLEAVHIFKKFFDSTHFNPYVKDSTIFTKCGLCLQVYKVLELRTLESK